MKIFQEEIEKEIKSELFSLGTIELSRSSDFKEYYKLGQFIAYRYILEWIDSYDPNTNDNS
jgi:hypothetical protein